MAGLAWEDANLPIPNLVIINPENGHAHLVWELENPIWATRPDKRHSQDAPPVRYLKAVQKAMAKALKADTAFNGLLVKNPIHPSWALRYGSTTPYRLADLCRHLDLSTTKEASIKEDYEGRNSTLFHSIRYWAYGSKSTFDDFDEFRSGIDDQLDILNQTLPFPLSTSEVNGIAKSVAKWVWYHYHGKKRRGIMGLDPTEDLQVRQQKGQAYTSNLRSTKTLSRIQKAYDYLVSHDLSISQSAVALHCQIHRNTVSRYWSQIQKVDSVILQPHTSIKPTNTDQLTLKHSLRTEETVSLRDQSSSEGASPQPEGLPDTHSTVQEHVYSYQDIIGQYENRTMGVVKACQYADQQARRGVLITGVSAMLKSTLLKIIDNWRNEEDKNVKPTTQ